MNSSFSDAQAHHSELFTPQTINQPSTQSDQPEVLDVTNKLAVRDFYKAKQTQLLALVASLPLLAGLLASIVLTFQSQELRRQALSPIETLAESMCVNGQAVIQVGIKSSDLITQIQAKDAHSLKTTQLEQKQRDTYTNAVIATELTKLPSSFVVFSVIDQTNNSIKIAHNYEAVDCR